MISHEIPKTNLALACKFDYYNPNTNVSGDEIGAKIGTEDSYTGVGDVAYTTISGGLIFTPTRHLRFSL